MIHALADVWRVSPATLVILVTCGLTSVLGLIAVTWVTITDRATKRAWSIPCDDYAYDRTRTDVVIPFPSNFVPTMKGKINAR